MDAGEVVELAREVAVPAVTVMMALERPVGAHPENALRLRALVERALDLVTTKWGADAAAAVRAQLDAAGIEPELGEHAHSLAVLASSKGCRTLRLPFSLEEQVVVDDRFAICPVLAGLARHPRYRVLVLAGHRAELFEGRADSLSPVTAFGFPLEVEPPREWDTPHRDLPIHEEAEKEARRMVYRAVDDALDAAVTAAPLPLVVAGPERELALFDQVTRHGSAIVGRVHGSYAGVAATELAKATGPALEAHLARERDEAVGRVRDALGRHRAVVDLTDVRRAAGEGRGHQLVVEDGFTAPGTSVDAVIDAVVRGGGDVQFVDAGSLDDCGGIGLLLRYAPG